MDTTRDIMLTKALRTSIRSMTDIREMSLKITRISELLQMEFDADVQKALQDSEERLGSGASKDKSREYQIALNALEKISAICADHVRGAYSKMGEIKVVSGETIKLLSGEDEDQGEDAAINQSNS